MSSGPIPDGAPRERPSPSRWAGVAIAGVALCCGLPVILAAGSTFTLLGLGLRSWVLLTAGIVVALAGGLALRSKRHRCAIGLEPDRSRLRIEAPIAREEIGDSP